MSNSNIDRFDAHKQAGSKMWLTVLLCGLGPIGGLFTSARNRSKRILVYSIATLVLCPLFFQAGLKKGYLLNLIAQVPIAGIALGQTAGARKALGKSGKQALQDIKDDNWWVM